MDILRHQRDRFEPVLLTAAEKYEELLALKKEFPRAMTALANDGIFSSGKAVQDGSSLSAIGFFGKDGLLNAIAKAEPDITVNGITGAAGLEPSVAAINAGSDLALANKESVVMAGPLIFELARKNNVNVIPVDSEHTAVLKLLEAHGKNNVSEIILTASGGPFRNYSREQLATVTPDQALAHPTWNMGPKITIDSATLANKGLEVIEAAGYFDLPPDKIKAAVHPQSIVHSMIRLKNGAVYAQLSRPDMRLTIHDALTWPETVCSPFGTIDFDSLRLDFEKPDFDRFPMLALAYEALKGGPLLPAAYNAANEIAVEAFLKGKITFLEIPALTGYVIYHCRLRPNEGRTIDKILELDREARGLAAEYVKNLKSG
jgi:1-deoxy-D-xylulose-5-phosphate reductoisomerase